ncbi:MAG: hypothetical protein H0T73_13055, partial [Ardenticatenales bacterium]|nr:hypothetical protein [Ardenticatenales bacterium]
DVQSFRKEMDAALESYAGARALFEQVGSKLGQANVLQAIGDVQSFRKEMDAALESYAGARALFEQVGAKLGQANVLKAIGDVQSFRDDKDAALESYAGARALFEQVGDKLGQANVLLALGRLQGEGAAFEQAIALYQYIGDRYSVARGQYYFALHLLEASPGDRKRARTLLEEARAGWAAIHFDAGVIAVEQVLQEMES